MLHKVPNHFTHLFFLNSKFCGDKKKVLYEMMFPDNLVLKSKELKQDQKAALKLNRTQMCLKL